MLNISSPISNIKGQCSIRVFIRSINRSFENNSSINEVHSKVHRRSDGANRNFRLKWSPTIIWSRVLRPKGEDRSPFETSGWTQACPILVIFMTGSGATVVSNTFDNRGRSGGSGRGSKCIVWIMERTMREIIIVSLRWADYKLDTWIGEEHREREKGRSKKEKREEGRERARKATVRDWEVERLVTRSFQVVHFSDVIQCIGLQLYSYGGGSILYRHAYNE